MCREGDGGVFLPLVREHSHRAQGSSDLASWLRRHRSASRPFVGYATRFLFMCRVPRVLRRARFAHGPGNGGGTCISVIARSTSPGDSHASTRSAKRMTRPATPTTAKAGWKPARAGTRNDVTAHSGRTC